MAKTFTYPDPILASDVDFPISNKEAIWEAVTLLDVTSDLPRAIRDSDNEHILMVAAIAYRELHQMCAERLDLRRNYELLEDEEGAELLVSNRIRAIFCVAQAATVLSNLRDALEDPEVIRKPAERLLELLSEVLCSLDLADDFAMVYEGAAKDKIVLGLKKED